MAFPALVLQTFLSRGQVTLALCSRMLLVTMALTAAARVLCRGVPKHWRLQKREQTVTGKLWQRAPAAPLHRQALNCTKLQPLPEAGVNWLLALTYNATRLALIGP